MIDHMDAQKILLDAKAYVEKRLTEELDPKYTYHNIEHTLDVFATVGILADDAGISDEDKWAVQLAALFHDVGFVINPDGHEEESVKIAREYLIQQGVEQDSIDTISACILATRMGAQSSNPLCQLLQDADLNKLSCDHFVSHSDKLRKEKSYIEGRKISKKEWKKIDTNFLTHHKYKTEVGRQKFGAGLKNNIDLVTQRKSKTENIDKKKGNIANNKTAQTQFKTALRNHIDLSNIADNKANIMISVNALILTVALPFLIDRSMDNPCFWIPTVILGVVCLVSMIFATIATRPIYMKGITSEDDITNNNSNLFFFGNFYKMEYNSYKEYIKDIVSEEEKLDDSIITDLYNLGRSLGKKFNYLRYCYNSFMYGIIAVVLSFVVTILGK